MSIGGFGFSWGAAPPVLLYFQIVSPLTLRFCFENRFIKCPLILSSETLTLLYFTLHLEYAHNVVCCLSWKVKFSFGGGEGAGERESGGFGPLFLNRPFYSCVLSYLAMNASEAGGDLALTQTSPLFSCKCKLVSIRTTSFTQQKQVTFSLVAIKMPGHKEGNCKMVYLF